MVGIADRIARDLNIADLVERLGDLPPSELNSLMLEVERRQSARRTPKQVLDAYDRSRFSARAPRWSTSRRCAAWYWRPVRLSTFMSCHP